MKRYSLVLLGLLTLAGCSSPSLSSSSDMVSSELETMTSSQLENEELNMVIRVNDHEYQASIEDSPTGNAFKALLPMTLNMSELNGNEKYYYLEQSLPTDSYRSARIEKGDIMLFGNSCLVIFYDSFSTSYSYTKIGKINDASDLDEVLGNRGVTVSFE